VRRALHIVLVLLAAAACQGPRIIPKGTLTDIYEDMFLADQMVREENMQREDLDSLLLYEAVFEKYGYDTDDYLYTVRHNLRDPERFSKVFEAVAKRLEGKIADLDKVIEHQNWVARNMGAKRPRLDSILAPFANESVYVGLARVERDSSRYPAWFRLVPVREDTLMISVDSLAAMAARDSLNAKAAADTTAQDLDPEKPAMSLRKPREALRPAKLPTERGVITTEEIPVEEIVLE
jgi:hypothetical protein